MPKHRKETKSKSGKRRFYKRKTFWGICGLLCFILLGAAFLFANLSTRKYRDRAASYDLENINQLELPSLILDRNGEEIGRIFVQNRSVIEIADVSELFIDTLRAGEDSRFLTHDGIDYIGVLRAVKLNFEAGATTQGASTITQQLARNAYPLREDALERGESGLQRKIVEAFLAQRIEERYSKRQILEFYLNRIYLGSGFYGLRSASLGYFGKEPKDLTLNECATIVGLIKNPTNNSPLNDPRQSRSSRNNVLSRMVEEDMITRGQAAAARVEELEVNPKPLQRGTSHLYERIADAVSKRLGKEAFAKGGLTIHTTIHSDTQEAAEKALEKSLAEAELRPGYEHQKRGEFKADNGSDPEYLQGAVLMVDNLTGEVLAHVGGRDYAKSPYDFIEMGRRPLGTAFFPFLYAAALADKHTPASTVEDEPMDNRAVMVGGREGILGEWGMEISNPKYEGSMTLRKAFQDSKIAATVRLGAEVGIPRIIDAAVAFGFSMKDSEPLPRVCVGWEPASIKEAVTAMATFPLGGRKGPRNFSYVDRIEDQEGKVLFRRQNTPNPPGRLLDRAVSWQVHNMMATGLSDGSARGAREMLIERPFTGAGKGGTTHDFADTWFLGYNSRITCGVWTGFLGGGNKPIYPGAFSRDLAMPIWTAAMNAAAPSFGGGDIRRPKTMEKLQICSVTGQRATQFCQELVEDVSTGSVKSVSTASIDYFRKGTGNVAFCSLHSGSGTQGQATGLSIGNMTALDVIPIQPQDPVLVGEDPYHSELPNYVSNSEQGGLLRRSTNVLDSLDLDEYEDPIRMQRPKRLKIYLE